MPMAYASPQTTMPPVFAVNTGGMRRGATIIAVSFGGQHGHGPGASRILPAEHLFQFGQGVVPDIRAFPRIVLGPDVGDNRRDFGIAAQCGLLFSV